MKLVASAQVHVLYAPTTDFSVLTGPAPFFEGGIFQCEKVFELKCISALIMVTQAPTAEYRAAVGTSPPMRLLPLETWRVTTDQ